MAYLASLALFVSCAVATMATQQVRDYCVIGAGPAGCQMGHLLEKAGRDYIMFERGSVAGNFYTKYPIHRTLISINKRNTGKTNKEFNMRHDWNSLLTDDESLQFRHYSKEMFPSADILVRYLNDMVTKLNLKVQFNTYITSVTKEGNKPSGLFVLKDQNGTEYKCKDLVMSTGIWKENLAKTFKGMEHTENYADLSVDREKYEGQSVLIIGRGNSAFETADSMISATNLIHVAGRSRLKLAWSTHYVGDLRAINNGLLDTYQLKSLDGLIDGDIQNAEVIKRGDKLYVKNFRANPGEGRSASFQNSTDEGNKMTTMDNYVIREPYDRIIRCVGFKFDFTIFDNLTKPLAGEGKKEKYPLIKPNFESTTVERMYFAGTNTHSLDWRKSAGGFIHGFRYTTRTLHRHLEWKNHQVVWPHVTVPQVEVINVLLKRINEASGLYQMYSFLSDVIIFRENGMAEYYEELPLKMIPEFEKHTGSPAGPMVVFDLEYGKNFSGAGKDVFQSGLSVEDPARAHHCGFLHPVIYFYKQPVKALTKDGTMPRPDRLHHVVEDFLTLWTANNAHFRPLRRFFENILEKDLKVYFADSCFKLMMTHNTVPKSCEEHYLKGQILQPTEILDEVRSY